MAKILTTTPADTATGTEVQRTLPSINYGADFRATVDDPAHVELTNVKADLDSPEKLTWKTSTISNIYKGTGIDASAQTSVKKGVNLMAKLNETWRLTDDTDASYEVLLPVQCHLVVNVPANNNISEENILMLVDRCVASLYDTTVEGSSRIASLLRGALMPTAL